MPGTCKNSATLNRSCKECVSSADNGSSETSNSSLDVDPINSHNGCHSRDNSFESSASSGSSGSHSRQVSGDSTGGVGLKKSLPQGASTPAINPLQFVKVKPCPLSQKAQEQIKLAKETKIAKEKVKEEEEEWQGNLDSWRSRRKKVVEKVIKRVEEIRQIELDEQLRHQPNKTKTFSRMMEERSLKRKPLNLAIYSDQEGGYSGELISDEERQQDVVQCGSNNENSDKDQSWKSEVFHEIRNEKYEQNGMNSQCFKHNRDDYFNNETSNATYMQLQEENILCSGVENSESSKAFCSAETGDSDSGSFVITNSVKDSHAKCNVFGNVSPDNSNVVEKCPSEHNTECADDSLEFTTGTELLEEFSSSQLVTRNDQHKCDSIELNLHLWLRKDSGVKDFGFKMKESDTSFTVESVDPGSASDLAGLRVGDEVWAINGEKTKGRAHSSLVFAIKQSIYTGLLELAVWRQFSTEKEREKEIIGVSETKLSTNGEYSFNENTDTIDNKEEEMNSNNSFSEFENKTLRTGISDSREPDIKTKTSFYETQSVSKVSGTKSCVNEQRTVKKPPPVPKKPKHVVLRKNSSTIEQTEVEENVDYPRNENSCVQKETFINDLKQLNIEVVTSFTSEASIELGASVDCKTSDHQQSEDVTQPQPLGTCDTKWTAESVKCELLQDQQLSNKVPSISIMKELQSLDSNGKMENTTKVSSEKPFHENNRYLDKPFSIETVKQQLQGKADERDGLPVYNPVKEELGLSIVYQCDDPPGVHTSSTTILQEDLTQEDTSIVNGRNIESELLSGGEAEATFNQEEDMKETFNLSNEVPASPGDITEQMEKFVLDQLEQDDLELRNILNSAAVEPRDQLELDVQEFDSLLLDEIDISPCSVEPPKEKPPPPPIDSELLDTDIHEGPYTKLRNDDTKSVKKELLKRRSDFLGINPSDVQCEFDDTLIQPPPNIEDILISERQLQRQLACQSEPNKNSVKTEELLIRKQETDSESEHYIGCNQNEEIAQVKREIISNLEQQQEIDHKDRIVKDNQTVDAECEEYFVKGYDVDEKLEEERKSMLEGESDMVDQQMGWEEEQPYKTVNTVQEVQQPYYRTDDVGATASSVSCVYQKTLIQDQEMPPTFRHASDHGLYRQKPFVHADSHSPTEESTWDREEMIRASRNPQGLDSQLVINTNRLVPDVGTEKGKVSPDSQSLVPEANIRRHENAAVHKRRSEPPVREQKYNINHWLIQEAEIRRIREKNEREKHRTPNIHQDVQNKPITPFQNGKQPVIRTNRNPPRPTSVPPPTPPKPSQVVGKVSSDQNLEDLFKSQSLGQVRRFSQGSSDTNGGHNWISGFTQTTGRDLSKQQDSVLSVSGKKRCCSCGNELGRGAAMIIESLQLFYHIQCFCCSVCHTQLGNGSCGTDVRVRNNKLHCQNCYSNDDGLKFSQV